MKSFGPRVHENGATRRARRRSRKKAGADQGGPGSAIVESLSPGARSAGREEGEEVSLRTADTRREATRQIPAAAEQRGEGAARQPGKSGETRGSPGRPRAAQED